MRKGLLGLATAGVAMAMGTGRSEAQCAPPFLFGPHQTVTMGNSRQSQAVVLRDLNGDGHPDLLVVHDDGTLASNTTGTVTVRLGLGDGGFGPVQTYAIGLNPRRIAVEDLDLDGYLDLAVSNFGGTTVSVLWGNGDGSFDSPASAFSAGGKPFGIATARMDPDGYPDLVLTVHPVGACGSGGAVAILFNDGNRGFFAPYLRPSIRCSLGELVAVDLNADGITDVATGSTTQIIHGTSVSLFRGIGDGTLGQEQFLDGGFSVSALVATDLDRDGRIDLVTGYSAGGENLRIFRGLAPAANGDPRFNAPVLYRSEGTNVAGLAVGDMNGDSLPDIVAVNRDSNTISILRQAIGGTFPSADVQGSGNATPTNLALADVNGEGRLDIVTANGLVPGAATILFDVGRQPSISGQPEDRGACVGSSVTFSVSAAGSGLSYQWRHDGVPIAGPQGTTADLAITVSGLEDKGFYDCVVSSACGSTTSRTAALVILDSECNACCVSQSAGAARSCVGVDDEQTCIGLQFVCDVSEHLPASFTGCFADADGNGFVNAGDRGFVAASIGATDPVLVCLYDLDGNGFVNAADRGYVSANIGSCAPLPDYMNGSGLNGGAPDPRYPAPVYMGDGMVCDVIECE